MNKNIEVTMESIKNGALSERFTESIEQVVINAMDRNTDYDASRKIVITMTFKSNEERDMVAAKIDIKTTLAPPKPLKTVIAIGRNGDEIGAAEVGNQILGQTVIDHKTGEIKEVGNKLVDMSQRAQGGK